MDTVNNLLSFLRSGWDTAWEGLDSFSNASLFAACFVTIIICVIIVVHVNVILSYVVLGFLGGAVYFLVLSIDVVRSWAGGASLALLVAIIAVLARLGMVWRKSERSGKAFTVVVGIALVLAIIPIVGQLNPDFTVGRQFSAALERTAQFIEELSDSAEQGARTVR